jgi:hypothetical protein
LDYLIPIIEPERYSSECFLDSARDIFQYDRQIKIRIPESLEINYCYFLSGDYQGINQDTIYRDTGIEIKISAQRVSTLIQLSTEPRYEITRTSSPVLVRGDSGKFKIKVQNIGTEPKSFKIDLFTPFGHTRKPDSFELAPGQSETVRFDFWVDTLHPLGEDTMKVIERLRDSAVVFTSWVVDLLTFQLPERPFIHSGKWSDTIATPTLGDTIPFVLVNNSNRTLKVTLSGIIKGGGVVKFGTPPFESTQVVDLSSLEDTILVAYIAPNNEADTVKIRAAVNAEDDTVYAIRPVEKSMIPDTLKDLFDDDFSSRNMNNWNIIYGKWDASDGVAKDTADTSHLAIAKYNVSPQPYYYKFQVNTKLKGSIEPQVDWLRSMINFQVQNNSKYYCFGFSGWSAADEVSLYKRENNNWSQLAKYSLYPYKIKKNVWYNLRVEVQSDSIKGFLDGNQVIGVKDTTFKRAGTGIGVMYESMRNCYEDVVVRRLQ